VRRARGACEEGSEDLCLQMLKTRVGQALLGIGPAGCSSTLDRSIFYVTLGLTQGPISSEALQKLLPGTLVQCLGENKKERKRGWQIRDWFPSRAWAEILCAREGRFAGHCHIAVCIFGNIDCVSLVVKHRVGSVKYMVTPETVNLS